MKRFSHLILFATCATVLTACTEYATIPPSDIGIILTPTGYDQKVNSPGQVDLGELNSSTNRGNSLILIQTSGIEIYEQFMEKDASPDKQDHRCATKNGDQVILDIRLALLLPDYSNEDGKKTLYELLAIGTPKALDAKPVGRVMRFDIGSIYELRAKMAVRTYIRELVSKYENFQAISAAFNDGSLNKRVKADIANILKDKHVPLGLLDAGVSNVKPDQTVVQAGSATQAATGQVEAMKIIEKYLIEDKTGVRAMIYQMQTAQSIASSGGPNGHNTIVVALPGGRMPNILPIKQ